jgi:hypothetical protein
MRDALKILLTEGSLDPNTETLLCEELSATSDQIEKLKLSEKHESLLEKIKTLLESRAKD